MKKSRCLLGEVVGGGCGGLLVGTPRRGGIGGCPAYSLHHHPFLCVESAFTGGVDKIWGLGPGTEAQKHPAVAARARGGEDSGRPQPDHCRASPRQGSSSC